ncbi:serine/threonine protein kinase [Colletotrichum asianum]
MQRDIHAEFLSYLQSDSARGVNFEKREFYFPRRITGWLLQKPPNETSSNAVRLFATIYNEKNSTGTFLLNLKDEEVERCPILFAILIKIDCGHMFHIFRHSIRDDYLGIPDLSDLYTDIERALEGDHVKLPTRYKSAEYRGVTEEFDKQRWAFNPALNVLNMGEEHVKGKSVLPFSGGETINIGGTAHVHHYQIHSHLVESKTLRQILEPTKQDPTSGMEYYEFAVKAYLKGYEDIYKLESEAFRGFNNTTDPKSLGVVTYLGEYTLHNRGREQDLDEYLADTYPPVLNGEIIAFWEGMFHIAKTLARIHQLEHVRGHSIQKYVGWHGDIKPDNILRVRGKFKLADFGFTRFEKSTIGKPQTTHLLGGTRTYGAPERDTSEGEDRILFSTTIDTWSLGCVFSAVATWVVLGSQGYENYGEMRVMAHEQLKKRHTADPSVSVSACIDAFHDGSQVLPAVMQWHDYLRNSSRKADTITCQVLDLIETGMLEKDPEKRLSSADLCTRLDTILNEAKATYQNALQSNSLKPESQEILSAMLELDKRAPKFAGPRPRPATESNGTRKGETIWAADNRHDPSRLAVARSSRVKKSERIDKILRGKIANREEVIQSGLIPEAIFELPNDERNISTGGEAAGNPSGAFRTTPYAQGNGVNATISSHEIPRNREHAPSIPAITYVYSEPDPTGTTHPGLPELVSPVTPTSPTQQPERFSTSVPVIGPLAHRTSTFRTRQEVPIVQQYKQLHAIWNKNNKWWAIQREVPQDEFLSQFIDNRDIVFIVDNAASMSYHWPDVTTTLLSLAMKIGTLDKDGLDLKFTIGEKHNVSGAQEWTILNKFSKSLESVGMSVDRRNMTNMATALLKIFDDYQNHDKKQTLIILTDGMWEASEHEDDVANAITDFIKALRGKLKKGQRRWFTIQFVSFGADERALERLRRLDDDLERLAENYE